MLEIEKIQHEVQRRGIKHLLHFTRINNLESIIDNGLVTRDRILSECISEVCNDQLRLDRTNGICLSISFPNYKMLYSYRMKFPDISWIIIGLSPEILWRKNCFFNYTNAASRAARSIPMERKIGILGFNELFSDLATKREYLKIPENYTTDPQAEIVVLENIGKEFIRGYAVSKKSDSVVLSSKFPEIKFSVVENFFSYRKDYEYWKSKKEEQ